MTVSLEEVHPAYSSTPLNQIEKEHFERSMANMLVRKGVAVQAPAQEDPSVEELQWNDFSEEQRLFFS